VCWSRIVPARPLVVRAAFVPSQCHCAQAHGSAIDPGTRGTGMLVVRRPAGVGATLVDPYVTVRMNKSATNSSRQPADPCTSGLQ
jgi:hypothetical protein